MATLTGVTQILRSAVFGGVVEVGYGEHHGAAGYRVGLAVLGVALLVVYSWHALAIVAGALADPFDDGLPFGAVGAAAWVSASIHS